MVSDETLHKKKKKKKSIVPEEGEEAPKKKKKKVDDTHIIKKKKSAKKKKKLKNSTMLVDPPAPLFEDDPPEELFGSRSPSPIQEPMTYVSPPPLLKYSPIASQDNGQAETLSDDESEEDEPIPETPVKSPKKVAKKTKIVPNLASSQQSPKKSDSDADSEADDMLDELPPFKGEPSSPATPLTSKWQAPITDPIISDLEQNRRDLLLLTQVKNHFKHSLVGNINWNDLFVYNMTPDEMSDRFEELLRDIPREKECGTLVSEAMEAFCNSFVRGIPRRKLGPVQLQALHPTQKKTADKSKKFYNAFTLFMSGFDPTVTSKMEIKETWEGLEKKEKMKLKKEARLLNHANGFLKKETKKRTMTVYQVFTREKMNQGLKMTEIGPLWKALTESEKLEYQQIAESTNRDRIISDNEVPASSQD